MSWRGERELNEKREFEDTFMNSEGSPMAYNKMSGKPTKGVSKQIDDRMIGSFMETGMYDVRVHECTELPSAFDFTFTNGFDEKHKQRVFKTNMDGSDMSYQLKCIIASTLEPTVVLDNIVARDFVNKSLTIKLIRSSGYQLHSVAGGFEAVANGMIIGSGKDIKSITFKDGVDVKRSYVKVTEYVRTRGIKHDNIQTNETSQTKTIEANRSNKMGGGATGYVPSEGASF